MSCLAAGLVVVYGWNKVTSVGAALQYPWRAAPDLALGAVMSATSNDPAQLLASLLNGGQANFGGSGAAHGTAAAGSDATPPVDPIGLLTTFTTQMVQAQWQFADQMMAFWSGAGAKSKAPPIAAKSEEKRFAADAWRNNPCFDLMRRTYLGYSQYLQGAVETVPLDAETKGQVRYGMRQFIDAMSPSNFLATNPEAMQVAFETGGQSLVQGMALFFEDLAKGRVSSTDETAYEVGKDIATTPGAVIFENELMQLIQFAPATATVRARPLLMIPPCINKYYILDLQPDNSIVRYIVSQGHTVFMVSWRNVGPQLGHLTWENYLEQGVMRALEIAREVSGADKVNTLGFCIGGTMLASALAVMRARNEDPAASMTLLTTMLDFADTGEIGALVTEQSIAAREAVIGRGGIMQGKELAFTFSSLRANDLIWQYVVNSYLKGKAPPAFDLLYWNADSTNLPGPMFCWYLRHMYLENNLRVPGGTTQCGVAVDLARINIPSFIYASREDHIVPWRSAYASTQLLAHDTTFVLGASGHIAGVINPASKNKRNHWVAGVIGADPEGWLQSAREVPGSWWPEWSNWLREHGGAEIPAPTTVGSSKHPRIEAAPGRYVMQKESTLGS
jgi:polyhydroxyalkanoate synthase